MNVQRLLQEPETFHNHKVLKNGSALVLRLDMDDGPVMCKIAHANNALLEREAARIQQLKSRYPMLGARLPAILGQGVIGAGLHRDKTFYLQEFIEGSTLAGVLQREQPGPGGSVKLLRTVTSALIDMLEEHDFDTGLQGRGGQWLAEYIGEAYHRLLGLEHIGYLASLDEIVVNGRPLRSLKWCLARIFESPAFHRLNRGGSNIAVLGHWNFHAENIIIGDEARAERFHVIDPDAKIDVSDPLFGLARLLYSFPHDTAENGRYTVETDAFLPNAAECNRFDITYDWPRQVIDNYSPLYTDLADKTRNVPSFLDQRLADAGLAARLDLSFLLCLLRGVSINHDTYFKVLDDSLRTFRNTGVLLFLTAINYANDVAERFGKN